MVKKILKFFREVLAAIGQYEIDRAERMQKHPEAQVLERLPDD